MRIKVQRDQLLQGINSVQKAISSTTIMSILKGVLIRGEDNHIYLTANDMQIAIEMAIEGEVLEPGSIVVDGKLFWDIVRRLKDDSIELSVRENQKIELKSEELDMSFSGFDSTDFPELPSMQENNEAFLDEGQLNKMIRQTSFAVSKGEHIQAISGALLEINEGEMIMAATDGYRFALAKLCCCDNRIRAKGIIPGSSLIQLGKLLSADSRSKVKISLHEKYAVFSFNSIKIITRLLQGNFINHSAVIPTQYESEIRVRTKDLLYSIEVASIFASYSNTGVKLDISDNSMIISSNAEIGSISKRVNIDKRGKDLVIAFNSNYILEGLRVFDEEEISICFSKGSNSPAVIKAIGSKDYEYLILPVRLSNNIII